MRWPVALAVVAGTVLAAGPTRADEHRAPPGSAKDADIFEPFNQKECDYPAPCGCNCDAGQAKPVQPPLGESLPGTGRPGRR